MTRLWNEPAVADDMTEGFVAANRRFVATVSGGADPGTVSPAGPFAELGNDGVGRYLGRFVHEPESCRTVPDEAAAPQNGVAA